MYKRQVVQSITIIAGKALLVTFFGSFLLTLHLLCVRIRLLIGYLLVHYKGYTRYSRAVYKRQRKFVPDVVIHQTGRVHGRRTKRCKQHHSFSQWIDHKDKEQYNRRQIKQIHKSSSFVHVVYRAPFCLLYTSRCV